MNPNNKTSITLKSVEVCKPSVDIPTTICPSYYCYHDDNIFKIRECSIRKQEVNSICGALTIIYGHVPAISSIMTDIGVQAVGWSPINVLVTFDPCTHERIYRSLVSMYKSYAEIENFRECRNGKMTHHFKFNDDTEEFMRRLPLCANINQNIIDHFTTISSRLLATVPQTNETMALHPASTHDTPTTATSNKCTMDALCTVVDHNNSSSDSESESSGDYEYETESDDNPIKPNIHVNVVKSSSSSLSSHTGSSSDSDSESESDSESTSDSVTKLNEAIVANTHNDTNTHDEIGAIAVNVVNEVAAPAVSIVADNKTPSTTASSDNQQSRINEIFAKTYPNMTSVAERKSYLYLDGNCIWEVNGYDILVSHDNRKMMLLGGHKFLNAILSKHGINGEFKWSHDSTIPHGGNWSVTPITIKLTYDEQCKHITDIIVNEYDSVVAEVTDDHFTNKRWEPPCMYHTFDRDPEYFMKKLPNCINATPLIIEKFKQMKSTIDQKEQYRRLAAKRQREEEAEYQAKRQYQQEQQRQEQQQQEQQRQQQLENERIRKSNEEYERLRNLDCVVDIEYVKSVFEKYNDRTLTICGIELKYHGFINDEFVFTDGSVLVMVGNSFYLCTECEVIEVPLMNVCRPDICDGSYWACRAIWHRYNNMIGKDTWNLGYIYKGIDRYKRMIFTKNSNEYYLDANPNHYASANTCFVVNTQTKQRTPVCRKLVNSYFYKQRDGTINISIGSD